MRHAMTGITLAVSLTLLAAPPAFTQNPSPEAAPEAAAATVANVYVQSAKGINVYDAAADGRLTLVKGSPFKAIGLTIGSTRKWFITLGTDWIHSFAIEPNGAIGRQVSEINTLDYDGASCSDAGTWGASLDHTGQNVYVEFNGSYCDAFQTFAIDQDSGELTFKGTAGIDNGAAFFGPQLTFTGNDRLAYDAFVTMSSFKRGSDGELETFDFHEQDPAPQISGWTYTIVAVQADRTNHLAAAGYWWKDNTYGEMQLSSYTIDAQGDVASTNTWRNMPEPLVLAGAQSNFAMSPSGKLLAVAASGAESDGALQGTAGLQVFHFNGADPITPYSGLITPAGIDQIAWDNNNHLYAMGVFPFQLSVYTVTPDSIAEAPGSPYAVPNEILSDGDVLYGLVVVPKL
jgi:hypothetical protein